MQRWLLLLPLSLCTLAAPLPAHADTKVLTAEGTYTMGDGETIPASHPSAIPMTSLIIVCLLDCLTTLTGLSTIQPSCRLDHGRHFYLKEHA
jgi:hypothetical protein